MSNKPNGGSALPNLVETLKTGDIIRFQPGMTLRDWFAGQALACVFQRFDPDAKPDLEDIAMQAYFIADAMLEERK